MPYQIDVWTGDLHQHLVSTEQFDDWTAAADFMMARMDEGCLCNVLHTDFKAPQERVREAEIALAKTLKK